MPLPVAARAGEKHRLDHFRAPVREKQPLASPASRRLFRRAPGPETSMRRRQFLRNGSGAAVAGLLVPSQIPRGQSLAGKENRLDGALPAEVFKPAAGI